MKMINVNILLDILYFILIFKSCIFNLLESRAPVNNSITCNPESKIAEVIRDKDNRHIDKRQIKKPR